MDFEEAYDRWMGECIIKERNPRRRELLGKGLGHGSVEFLRTIWYPVVGNFNFLYPEWEVRDFNNGFRYLDFAYMPGGVKGGIEIQGYGPHARDLDTRRFKDLCLRHSLLCLDGWTFLTIAYLSVRDNPKQCQQLILSFIGKFLSIDVSGDLNWLEAETVRLARRLLRPITALDVEEHLRVSDRHARKILKRLVELQILTRFSGKERARTYVLKNNN